jgi:hypothetical protein
MEMNDRMNEREWMIEGMKLIEYWFVGEWFRWMEWNLSQSHTIMKFFDIIGTVVSGKEMEGDRPLLTERKGNI